MGLPAKYISGVNVLDDGSFELFYKDNIATCKINDPDNITKVNKLLWRIAKDFEKRGYDKAQSDISKFLGITK